MTKTEKVLQTVTRALDDLKGIDAQILNVSALTTITDAMVVVSGRSNRHVKALADEVHRQAKTAGIEVLGSEGEQEGEWVLVDLAYVIVHIMLPRVRDLYKLENLWGMQDSNGQAHSNS